MNADHLIQRFGLEPHPEGGYYTRTHTSANGSFSAILFLLTAGSFSAFHRIRSDEQWNWYSGDAVHIHEIDATGTYTATTLTNTAGAENFQHVVRGGTWFASECAGPNGYALCGCTVVPEFRFSDFELAARDTLGNAYPQHRSLIEKLTRT